MFFHLPGYSTGVNISTFQVVFKYKISPLYIYVGTNVLSLKSHSISSSVEYIPRGRTVLHTILDKHFIDFVENYESKYAEECGRYSLERITAVVEEYLKCGDYKQGWSQAKLAARPCNLGCSQKRTLLFGDYLTDEV